MDAVTSLWTATEPVAEWRSSGHVRLRSSDGNDRSAGATSWGLELEDAERARRGEVVWKHGGAEHPPLLGGMGADAGCAHGGDGFDAGAAVIRAYLAYRDDGVLHEHDGRRGRPSRPPS